MNKLSCFAAKVTNGIRVRSPSLTNHPTKRSEEEHVQEGFIFRHLTNKNGYEAEKVLKYIQPICKAVEAIQNW